MIWPSKQNFNNRIWFVSFLVTDVDKFILATESESRPAFPPHLIFYQFACSCNLFLHLFCLITWEKAQKKLFFFVISIYFKERATTLLFYFILFFMCGFLFFALNNIINGKKSLPLNLKTWNVYPVQNIFNLKKVDWNNS